MVGYCRKSRGSELDTDTFELTKLTISYSSDFNLLNSQLLFTLYSYSKTKGLWHSLKVWSWYSFIILFEYSFNLYCLTCLYFSLKFTHTHTLTWSLILLLLTFPRKQMGKMSLKMIKVVEIKQASVKGNTLWNLLKLGLEIAVIVVCR